nr:PP0621 family protein [uncultured Pseudomonas sp.]
MGLFRLLFLIAIAAAAYWLWRRIAAPTRRHDDGSAAPMVRCAHCGVHVPRTRALLQDDNWYCSQAHLEQGTKQQ